VKLSQICRRIELCLREDTWQKSYFHMKNIPPPIEALRSPPPPLFHRSLLIYLRCFAKSLVDTRPILNLVSWKCVKFTQKRTDRDSCQTTDNKKKFKWIHLQQSRAFQERSKVCTYVT
jgi:hypothetical protein